MLILLPPSQTKAFARTGRPLDLATLSMPELTPARAGVLNALVELCGATPAQAMTALGLTSGLAGEVDRNAALRKAPALPAGRLYTGVLYDALDLAGLSPTAKRAAGRSLLIFSGLWGVLRIADRVPPYRLSMGLSLPGLGPLGSYWKAALGPAITAAAGSGVVLDLRSSEYSPAWAPPPELRARTATVRVLHEHDGQRAVVSHFNKATKGAIVRRLLEAGLRPRGVPQLIDGLTGLGYQVEAHPGQAGRAWQLDVIVTQLAG
jgi:cytoplasmic iron level regulating protein YaaA (DUF328/UPF0246 family)